MSMHYMSLKDEFTGLFEDLRRAHLFLLMRWH